MSLKFFSFVGVLMQLVAVDLSQNKLEGILPKAWSRLTSVSSVFDFCMQVCVLHAS